jgi:hypothetical protein
MINFSERDLAAFSKGGYLNIKNLRLENRTGVISVSGWSQYLNFSSITQETALRELAAIKTSYLHLIVNAPQLKDLIGSRPIEYILCYDDAAKASVDICKEKDGVMHWLFPNK